MRRSTWCSSSSGSRRSCHRTPWWSLGRQTRASLVPGESPAGRPAKHPCSGTGEGGKKIQVNSDKNKSIGFKSIKRWMALQKFDLTLWTDISSTRHSSIDSSREWPEISILMRWERMDLTSSSSSPATSGKTWLRVRERLEKWKRRKVAAKQMRNPGEPTLPVPLRPLGPLDPRWWPCWWLYWWSGTRIVDMLPERSHLCPVFLSTSMSQFQHFPKEYKESAHKETF